MKLIQILFLIVLVALVTVACQPAEMTTTQAAQNVPAQQEPAMVRIAVLPIIDALPLYVAQQEGLFAKYGVQIELISVASAPERDQLVAAQQADGMINETISDMLFNKDNVQVQAVRYALRPAEGYGHFFILASGKSGITSPEQLKGVEIGVSQGTVIEYVTERLLQAEGLQADEIVTLPVPKMPDRMALLASGELQAGTLPDPLGALAVQSGATIVLDNSAHPEYGFSVYTFRKDVIDAHPEAIRGFLAAIEEAVQMINANPTAFTDNFKRGQNRPRAAAGGL